MLSNKYGMNSDCDVALLRRCLIVGPLSDGSPLGRSPAVVSRR